VDRAVGRMQMELLEREGAATFIELTGASHRLVDGAQRLPARPLLELRRRPQPPRRLRRRGGQPGDRRPQRHLHGARSREAEGRLRSPDPLGADQQGRQPERLLHLLRDQAARPGGRYTPGGKSHHRSPRQRRYGPLRRSLGLRTDRHPQRGEAVRGERHRHAQKVGRILMDSTNGDGRRNLSRAMPKARYLAIDSDSNRLIASGFSTTSGGPHGGISSPSHVYFSDPGDPEAWTSNNFVQLHPGDGEAIQGSGRVEGPGLRLQGDQVLRLLGRVARTRTATRSSTTAPLRLGSDSPPPER
jgi:hypothetical protein